MFRQNLASLSSSLSTYGFRRLYVNLLDDILAVVASWL